MTSIGIIIGDMMSRLLSRKSLCHKAVGRSSDLLLTSASSHPFEQGSDIMLTLQELTAAGTVRDSHPVPY